jgi:ankyrin repeat protein
MLTKSVNDCLRRDDVDALKTYIDASNVLNKSEFESYVLHYVCFDRAIKCLDYVLSIGADVNCVDRQNDTALHYSAFNGQYKCTRMLLEAYANPNMYNDKKESPLNGAIKDDRLGIIKLIWPMWKSFQYRQQRLNGFTVSQDHVYYVVLSV